MTQAQLCQQGIDCADLNSRLSAGVAEFGSSDVVTPVRHDQWQAGKALDNLCARLGT